MDCVVHSMDWIENSSKGISLLFEYFLHTLLNWLHSRIISNPNILFYPKSKDHPFNKHMNSDLNANDWSPEKGFVNQTLKNDLRGYPRPGLGKLKTERWMKCRTDCSRKWVFFYWLCRRWCQYRIVNFIKSRCSRVLLFINK